jgi:hypothetical protein
VLSESEQRSWNEIERMWTEDSRGSNGIRALAVGAVGIAIMFAVIGAPWAALVVLAVPALAWSLSGYWRDIGTACEATLVPMDGWVAAPDERHRTPQAN